MGDPNASIPTPQPVYMRQMFGAFGRSLENSSVSFVSEAGFSNDIGKALQLRKKIVPVKGTRSITKSDMVYNDLCPNIEVDPET